MRSQQRKHGQPLRSLRAATGAKAFGTAKRQRARRAIEELEKDKRGWIRHGIAALAIAGLGLGAAGAVALTGSASEVGAGAAPGVSVAANADGNNALSDRGDGTSRTTQRQSLTGNQAGQSGEPLDGTVDMTARRDAQKNAKVTDTSTESSAASKAGVRRAEALKSASASSEKLSTKLSKEERERQLAQARAGADTGSTTTGTSTDTGSTDSQDLTSSSSSDGQATLPVAKGSYSIAATFGQVGSWARYHTGIDFAAPIGTPIHATANGVITNAGIGSASSWAGNYVTLKFADGRQMLFAHMSSVSVSAGQQVTAGQLIGHVGQTGRAFGPHTHVELYPAGVTPGDVYSATDPAVWFRAHGLNP